MWSLNVSDFSCSSVPSVFILHVSKLNPDLKTNFEAFDYFNFLGHAIYEVALSERFKNTVFIAHLHAQWHVSAFSVLSTL